MFLTRLRAYITTHTCRDPLYCTTRLASVLYLSPSRAQNFGYATIARFPLELVPNHSFHQSRSTAHVISQRYPGVIGKRRYAATTLDEEPGPLRAAALLVAAPNREELDSDEDIELLSEEDAKISITERAAEKLFSILAKENNRNLALRIAVESGGCHGYQYKMELSSERGADDYQFVHPKFQPSSVVVDAVSLGLLKGSTVDYAAELIGSSFRILDNPQAKGSGCGCGISWEANF